MARYNCIFDLIIGVITFKIFPNLIHNRLKMIPIGKHKVFDLTRNFLISKISKIINADESSKNSMISIYVIETEQFLCCNEGIKKFIGENYPKLFDQGWEFWFELIDFKESKVVKEKIKAFITPPHIYQKLNLRYHITNVFKKRIFIKHEIFMYKLKDYSLLVNYLFDISEKEKIEHCFKSNELIKFNPANSEQSYPISSREREVLGLIGDGFSSKQIAYKLYISNHTAISHRKNLFE